MANWDKFKWNGNVDDRRGAARKGGLGVVGVIVVVALGYFVGGQAPEVTLGQLLQNDMISVGQSSGVSKEQAKQYAGNDEYEKFARSVMGSLNETWKQQFNDVGKTYRPPTLVLFRGNTASACGGASSRTGPHYCPADRNIYLDETFFDQLQQLGGSKGDVAQGYVIAHEVGHHVQNQLRELRSSSNAESVAVELQADCYAGVWAHDIQGKGILEVGDIDEALSSAAAVGDDNIQQTTQGRVSPENWTHGSSDQRKKAFMRGFEAGRSGVCRQ